MKQKRGPGNNQRKLKERDIDIIKDLLKQGKPQRIIAEMFNVSASTIWKISAGYTYNTKRNKSSLFYLQL